MKKENIILLGGGGHCKSCIDVIENEGKYDIIGILDVKDRIGTKLLEYEFIGTDDDLSKLSQTVHNFLVTVGHIKSPQKRIELFSLLEKFGLFTPTIVSSLAYVSPYSSVGPGSIIMHHAIINAGAKIGKNCIINSKALIEHDAVVGDHCHISTGAIVNGGVEVGERSFIGSGAVSVQYRKIPPDSFIKANGLFVY